MTQKNVIVTGAARGLGLAICQQLADANYKVIGVGRRNSDAFEKINNADFHQYDLNNIDGIPDLVNDISRQYGQIYALVNNAGIGNDGVLSTMHASDINAVLRVNLEAPIFLTKYVSRKMLKHRDGCIVNVSSIIASTGFNGLSVYAASKAGLEGFTRSLSREVGKIGIRVNCLAPGYMETDMTASLTGSKLESVRRRAPLGLPTTNQAAGAVIFLLSSSATGITGQVITVDGGATA